MLPTREHFIGVVNQNVYGANVTLEDLNTIADMRDLQHIHWPK
jgi:hypothetical protein